MKRFIYNGQSTEDILDVPLMLATFDSIDEIQGISRDDNIGEQTVTRITPNEYGTINALPSFSYGLIKSDRSPFNGEEQRIVEKWLTSPRYSQELQVIDYNASLLSLRDEMFFDYNNSKDLVKGKDTFNSVIDYEYDVNGNLLFEKDNNGVSVSYNYQDGLLTSSSDRYGITTYLYDSQRRLIKILYPNNRMYSYDYSGDSSCPYRAIASDGDYVLYTYDKIGNVIKEIYSNGNTIEYAYNNNVLVSSVDKRGTTYYRHDSNNNLIQIDYPDGQSSYYTYKNNLLIRSVEPDKYTSRKNIYLNNQRFYYYGQFMETTWHPCCGGYAGITFTFNCRTDYPYRKYFNTFVLSGNQQISFNCATDNADDYVYPVIYFSSTSGNGSDFNFSIESVSDNSKTMKAIMKSGANIVIDCQHCIIWNYADRADISTRQKYSFSDMGWNDVGNIYWVRLLPGINNWKVSGNGILEIEYKSQYKKVGGWL